MGDNIPGKTREPLLYVGGVPTYFRTINEVAANGYAGFSLEQAPDLMEACGYAQLFPLLSISDSVYSSDCM